MDSLNTAWNVGVHLNDDLIRVFGVDIRGSDRCGGDNVAIFVNCSGFDYRNVDVLQEVVLDPHRHLSQRNVVIGYHTGVYRITQILVGLVRHSRFKSARPCKLAVELLTKGGSGVHRKLQLFAVPCAFRKLSCDCLRISRDGESADAERHFRLYEFRRLFRGHYFVVISGIPYPAQEIFMCIHVHLLLVVFENSALFRSVVIIALGQLCVNCEMNIIIIPELYIKMHLINTLHHSEK